MAEFYDMPAISPTMETGTLVSWRIAEGDRFESSAVVAEVGTDKANMEAEIYEDGVLLKHLITEGDEVPPGFPIAIWGESTEEDIQPLLDQFATRQQELTSEGTPAAEPKAQASTPTAPKTPAPQPAAARPTEGVVSRKWMSSETASLFMDPPGDLGYRSTHRVPSSPLARKVAADLGVDLQHVTGTGPGGRVVRADVEEAAKARTQRTAHVRADEVMRNSPMRKTIARRLLDSHTEIPTFFLTATFDMQGFVDLRTDLKAKLPDVRISYNDILIAAVSRALLENPQVNASWGATEITRHGRVDIGVAVALEDGLITPVIRSADQLSLSQIASQVRDLAGRAKAMKLGPEDYTGSTFTISNLGMMEIDQFTAIINPPEAAILAVGAIREEPVFVDGSLERGVRMSVTMTCDHRVIDGATGAHFLQTLRRYVESPWLLLV
jgi:pyruvate dehydrogenase E2 component (dihydrolipoamide acetyltransferase)